MAPTSHVNCEKMQDTPHASKTRIVISGISGLYPGANNVMELSDILYKKVNPVTKEKCRYKFRHPETVDFVGVVPGLERFDAQFFKVNHRLASNMDPMSSKILEQTYSAIYDAGVAPDTLANKKVGVYIGATISETEKFLLYKTNASSGIGMSGCSRSMFANRISYWLNVRGPSYTVDGSCCGSMVALQLACQAMASGECEAAVVAASRLYLHPQSSIYTARMTKVSRDGKTRCFDENASGCAISEAINVIFLQKSEDALRVYADIDNVKIQFNPMQQEFWPRFGYCRDAEVLSNFLNCFYEETNISPRVVSYIEACGLADPDTDKAELEAIDKVFCNNRNKPLHVGSVMSNIGYTDAACGIAAITKVVLGYHTGKLAANLHLDNVRSDIDCLNNGRVQILKEHQTFLEGYAGINGLSLSGTIAHVLIHNRYKPKNLQRYKSNIPYLVTLSGRQESSVVKIINALKSHPVDPEQIALLHNIHVTAKPGHMARGFAIIDTNSKQETVCLGEEVDYFDDMKRPLWFVYSGMGSQWAGMGAHLLQIPVFANAIERCRQVLEPKGIDILDIITSTDKSTFDNILNSFVGIAAIQIGLTDVLTELGLVPDKIIGHSVGELGCAYADGCFTAEEMILAAYYRGLVSLETPLIHGAMAAVGIGYQQIINMCPSDIEVACHNSKDSCTISGPVDSIKAFAKKLSSEGIFVKEVDSSKIAYHSRYIATAGPALLKYLREVIKSPKLRSKRWICTSVPEANWDAPDSMYSSAEYHANNLLNPVLFEEASVHIPAKAVLVEIAPHGLLQAILKRALPYSCVNIPLTLRQNNNLAFLLTALGKIYMKGIITKIAALYPKVEFPVSTGTPMLSHLVEWAHGEPSVLAKYIEANTKLASVCNFVISIHDDEHSYLQGNRLRGKIVYPFAAVLMDVLDTMCMSLKLPFTRLLSVHFRDVRLYAQPTLHESRQLHLTVTLQRGSGRFEVMDDVSKVATGYITHQIDEESSVFQLTSKDNITFDLTSEDFYEFAFNRDYCYRGDFRSIRSATSSLTEGRVLWRNNWVTFIDGILQLGALRRCHETVSLPEYIRRLCINISEHEKSINMNEDTMIANVFGEGDRIRCGGVVIENIKYRDLVPLNRGDIYLEALKFDSNWQTAQKDNRYILASEQTIGSSVNSNVQLKCAIARRLDSLDWMESPSFNDEGLSVSVLFAGLNHKAIEKRFGEMNDLKQENKSGMNFSGTLNNGLRVMGIGKSGAVRNQLKVRPEMLWPVPAWWSLEDAATVPIAYCQAYYCLVERFQLFPGMSIYIEDGVSAFGQAVISISLAINCEVFTTVKTAREKRLLLTLFPDLKDDHICGGDFAQMILSHTNGNGCDFVISSPRGEVMTETLKCACSFGLTIVVNYEQECNLGMYYLCKERNVFLCNFSQLLQQDNIELMNRLQKLVCEGIVKGIVRPLIHVTYSASQAERAFRQLTADSCGSVLLNLQQSLPSPKARILCSPEKLQLIVCANEALGLILAEKLMLSGARKFHLHSQQTLKYTAVKLRQWLKQDMSIDISSEDIRNEANVRMLLNNCNSVAPVEGVYVITLEDSTNQSRLDNRRLMIQNLDTLSRKLCPYLKYFAIIDEDCIGRNTCISRGRDNLPATMLKVSNLNKINAHDKPSNGLTRWEAVNALDEAVRSKQAVVTVSKHVSPVCSILSTIVKLTNLTVPENLHPETSLVELGLDELKAGPVSSYLQDEYNIYFSPEEIPALTINKLEQIEDIIFECKGSNKKGLETFFSYVNPDELIGTMDMIFPNTLIKSNMNNIEIASKEQHFVIVPGMEGSHARFERLCERLKLRALVLQPGVDCPRERPDQLARRYVQILLKNLELKSHFYLVGYETGVIVALEMAIILEEHGLTGTIFCLGGGPQAISAAVKEVASSFGSEDALREATLKHLMQIMSDSNNLNTKALETIFRDGVSWESKVDMCVRSLLGSVSHSAQYTRQVFETLYARLQQARSYTVKPHACRSLIVALMPTSTSPDVTDLQKYSQQPVQVYQLRSHLHDAANDLRCAAILNRHLSPDLLREFTKKNRCEVYNLSSDTIAMTKT